MGKERLHIKSPASFKWLVAVAISFMVAGCANVGVERQAPSAAADRPEPGKGLVIFYRESKFAGGGVGFNIYDLDKPPSGTDLGSGPRIGGLPNGSYFAYQAKPGKHVFTGSTTARPSTIYTWLTVEPDKTYYMQASLVRYAVAEPSHPDLKAVDSEEGSAAIKKLQPVALKQ